jgi:hypothetical protein
MKLAILFEKNNLFLVSKTSIHLVVCMCLRFNLFVASHEVEAA